MTKEFDSIHAEAIKKHMVASMLKDVKVARSWVYETALVIGRPDLPGTVMVSFHEESSSEPGRSCWFISWISDADPKTVADGKTDPGLWESKEVFYWAEMLKEIRSRF